MDLVEAATRGFEDAVRHPWETARLDVVKRLISTHVPLPRGADVMDIGCGDAVVVEHLAAAHPDATFHAVDTAFTPDLIAEYRRRLKIRNVELSSSLESVACGDRAASLILLMDVIEHISNDREFLSMLAAKPCVGQDTRLVITVPAYRWLFCSHDSFLGHYRRYSSGLLKEVVEQAGFEIVGSGTFFFSLLPFRALQVLRERVLKAGAAHQSTGLVTWKGGPVKAAILSRLLVLDASVSLLLNRVGIRLPGLSHYAICRKAPCQRSA